MTQYVGQADLFNLECRLRWHVRAFQRAVVRELWDEAERRWGRIRKLATRLAGWTS